jgi:iron complex transport system substrate-binding protein
MRKLRAGVLALGLLALAGCADPNRDAAPGEATVTVSSCGQELAFETPPERVVTLDQTSTETMLALGLEDRLIGTSNLKTKVAPEYREAYEKVPVLNPKLLTGEQLRAAAPDLVVASFVAQYTADRVGTREELAEIGLPSYVSAVECPDDNAGASPFDLLFTDFELLGEVFGVRDRAAALIEEQRGAVAAASEAGAKATGEPSVLWLYSTFNGVPYVAGGGTMPSEMSRLVGAVNAFDDVAEDWPEVSWERIAERDPDVIVVGDLSERGAPGDSAAEKIELMRAHPVLSQLAAVRDNRIIEVLGTGMDPSVRAVETLESVVAGMRELGYVG